MTLKKLNLSLLLIAMVAVTWSCSGSGSSGSAAPTVATATTPAPEPASTSGVALHAGAKWTKSDKGPIPSIWLWQTSAGDTGEVLGNRDVNKSRLSFKITGISSDLGEAHRWILWFKSDAGGENNFQLMVVKSDQTRFIMQRFGEMTDCTPRGLFGYWGCEEQDIHDDLGFEPGQTYQWDCYWDGTVDPKRVGCDVTTIGGTFSTKYEVGMGGVYGTLTEMAVGAFSIFGYEEVSSTVTDFRFSVL